MESSVLSNALSFTVAIVILTAVVAVFAFTIYYLIFRDKGTDSNAITVQKAGQNITGVPFFIKRSRWLQETTYLETLISCSLSAMEVKLDDKGKQVSTNIFYAASKITPRSTGVVNNLLMLNQTLAQAIIETDPTQQWKLWAENIQPTFESLPLYNGEKPVAKGLELPMISNLVKEEVYVDYGTQYSINYPQPLIGSANVAVELTADGTLGKTSAEIKDETFSTLLSAFPVKDVVSSTLAAKEPTPTAKEATEGVMSAVGRKPPSPKLMYRFSSTCKQYYVRHVFFKRAIDENYQPPIPLSDNSWYRQELIADLKPEDKSEKDLDKKGSD